MAKVEVVYRVGDKIFTDRAEADRWLQSNRHGLLMGELDRLLNDLITRDALYPEDVSISALLLINKLKSNLGLFNFLCEQVKSSQVPAKSEYCPLTCATCLHSPSETIPGDWHTRCRGYRSDLAGFCLNWTKR